MTKREVVGRYKGSVVGIAWSLFNPVLMLVIYTFVFSVVFKSRWGAADSDNKTEFATILFVGMIVFNLFAETINRAPSLILSNVNYVKKVIFPLEILPVINLGAALFHAAISFGVLICALLLFNGYLHWTVVFLPIVLIPFIFLIMGVSWFLASLGVYVRDVGQTIGVITTLMMFLSPIFYPISAVPSEFQKIVLMNPLSLIIEQARVVLVFGCSPNLYALGAYGLLAILMMYLGFSWFQKTRKGFADVL
jgi:lipopolysaccharide transport system permease protein